MIKRILLTAGGTGGHIFPALSFGQWIERNFPDIRVEYVCGTRPMEKEIYRACEAEPFTLSVGGSPLSGKFGEKLKRIGGMFKAFRESKAILSRYKPDCCLVFGGYISFPMLLACKLSGVPVAVQEQNAFAGKVTRIAAKLKTPIFSGWEECAPLKSGSFVRTGVPVRRFKKMSRQEAWNRLAGGFPMPAGKIVAVFGGSLGSTPMKETIKAVAARAEFKDKTFILPATAQGVERVSENVYLLPKIWDAAPLFRCADMAVTRAGGSSLFELGTEGIPSLIMPWSMAADNHQFHNAVAFMSENRSLICKNDSLELFAKKLLQLDNMASSGIQISDLKMYNKAEKICADLWAAVSALC